MFQGQTTQPGVPPVFNENRTHVSDLFAKRVNHNLFALKSGHTISYSEYGDSAGFPLVYFHDSGSSRLECGFFHRSAKQLGYRLIAIDRPGIGYSDFLSYTSATEFCRKVLELTSALKLHSFAVMSMGGGGVFALSMSHLAPAKVQFHLSLSGIPINVFRESANDSYSSSILRSVAPIVMKLWVQLKHRLFPDSPHLHIERLSSLLSYTDRKALNNPRVSQALELDLMESIRQGYQGVAQDVSLAFTKVDFRLEQIDVPVFIWQGSADNLSGHAESEFMVSRMPQASLFRVPNQGRFFFIQDMDAVFNQLKCTLACERAIA